jgi:superfamily II DNA or RNA helicase
MSYSDFLASKMREAPEIGLPINESDVNPMLHPWQAEIVAWAVRTGRCAIWADTGLGKTFMQLEWARLSGATTLIVAPLAVCAQTVREAEKLNIRAQYVRGGEQITVPGVYVTNYEMVTRFSPELFDAVVLDEASLLKNSVGAMRTLLIEHFRSVPRRLACTATPAPNDSEELTNQAEFLGVISRVEMLAAYFVHDSDAGWRLKGHARGPMFKWMASWAVAIRLPSDMGYSNEGYELPGLVIQEHLLQVDVVPEGELFATEIGGVGGRAQVRRATLDARVAKAVELVNAEPDEPWLIWCGLNDEADAITRAIPEAVNVHGSMSPEDKADLLLSFADGGIRVLVTKVSMASFGLNYQHCARMVFVGLNDSYEGYYQAMRRCYRYGQKRVVEAHVVLSALEGQIAANVRRKEREAAETMAELVAAIREAKNEERIPA